MVYDFSSRSRDSNTECSLNPIPEFSILMNEQAAARGVWRFGECVAPTNLVVTDCDQPQEVYRVVRENTDER